MIIKVIAKKIPEAWEVIKFAATQADGISIKNHQSYLNELLHALLNNKAQCFLRTDKEQKNILAVIITRLEIDKITNEKSLLLQSYYSFEPANDKAWAENMATAMEFAKAEKCSSITFTSLNDRILELSQFFGFEERHRRLDFKLGGT